MPIRMSTQSRYGLRALIYLARHGKRTISLKEISDNEEVTVDYLEKIFAKLEKAGIVKGKRGIGGGYVLLRDAKIGELIRILEGDTHLIKCLSGKAEYSCPREKKCSTRPFWREVQKSFDESLNLLTLKNLAHSKNEKSIF